MNKFLILFLFLNILLVAQETVKEPDKEPGKEATKETIQEPTKIEVKELPKDAPLKVQNIAPAKVLLESKSYWDEEKKKIKVNVSYYLKDKLEIPHGPTKSFHENGQLSKELNYVDGIIDGIETRYSRNGSKEHLIIWQKGIIVKDALFYIDGVMKSEVEFKFIDVKHPEPGKPDLKKQVKDGVEKIYYKDGKIRFLLNWTADIQNGQEVNYYPSGKKAYELTWKMGKKEGIESQWHKNGQLKVLTNWVDDKAQGEMVTYHENGVKKDQYNWEKGVIVGEQISWNDKGVMIANCLNKNGEPFKGTILDEERSLMLYYEDGRKVDSKVCDKDGKILGK